MKKIKNTKQNLKNNYYQEDEQCSNDNERQHKWQTGREENDFYSTPYCATQALLDNLPNGEPFMNVPILEPMRGAGHISNVLRKTAMKRMKVI